MFKRKFQIKNIAETLTVGDYFRRRREEKGLHLRDIGNELGIKNEYLENLESGDYKNLPPQVYVRGFIKSYANFLGIDGNQLIKIYNREMSFMSEDTAYKKEKPPKAKLKDYLMVTPKIVTFVASLFVVSILGYYFYHQVNSFNSKPYLFVESPSSDTVVKEKDLLVSGKTEGDATLKINGQDISVSSAGDFSQQITLSEGRNLLIVEAKNRFNKTDRKELNIVYEKPAEENKTVIEEPATGAVVPPVTGSGTAADGKNTKDENISTDSKNTATSNAPKSGSSATKNTTVKNESIPVEDTAATQGQPAVSKDESALPKDNIPAGDSGTTTDSAIKDGESQTN
jgi:cytoskeletal protein RodZ